MGAQLGLFVCGDPAADAFRFTWWNTPEGELVWVEIRGTWRPGVVVDRGRRYVAVEVEAQGGRHWRVRKPYSELRRLR